MVEDRITDGKRIAQLLSSELSGRTRGALADVAVVDADPDSEPSPSGTDAYGIAAGDRRIGAVVLYPDAVECELTLDPAAVSGAVRGEDLSVVASGEADGSATSVTLRVESGAAVKRAVDAIVAGIGAVDR